MFAGGGPSSGHLLAASTLVGVGSARILPILALVDPATYFLNGGLVCREAPIGFQKKTHTLPNARVERSDEE